MVNLTRLFFLYSFPIHPKIGYYSPLIRSTIQTGRFSTLLKHKQLLYNRMLLTAFPFGLLLSQTLPRCYVSLKRVVVISSYALFRDGLKRLLVKVASVEMADSIEEVEELVSQQKVDAVIVDQAENQISNSEIVSRLLSLPDVRVITVSLEGDEMQVYRYKQVGKASVEDLIEAILD